MPLPTPLVLSADRAVPVPLDRAFAAVLPMPLDSIFDRRALAFPPIKEVRDQQGTWGTPGQTRTIVLGDGGTIQERLVAVDAPDRFAYEIGRFTGPMKPLVSRVEGEWRFEPAGTGTRVTWQWTIHPTNAVTARLMPLLGRMWGAYARLALERIEQNLL